MQRRVDLYQGLISGMAPRRLDILHAQQCKQRLSPLCACVLQVQALLNSLDRRLSYFTITHFAELLAEERITVPCDLKVS